MILTIRASACLASVALAMAHCPPIGQAEDAVKQSLASIDTTLADLSTNAQTAQAQLTQLAADLSNRGMTQAASYVKEILANGIARVGAEYRCNADFTSSRLRDGLASVRQALLTKNGDALPTEAARKPFVCTASPGDIRWIEAPQKLAFHGYDINPDPSASYISATVVLAGGGEQPFPVHALASGPYEVAVNLSPSGAAFPRPCSKVRLYWKSEPLYEVMCATACPDAPPPIVVPAETRMVLNVTGGCQNSFPWANGCKYDKDWPVPCGQGYVRDPKIEVTVTGGKGSRHCGASDDQSPNAGRVTTHWINDDPSDCSIHAHAGLEGPVANGKVTCQFVVKATRPQKVIPQPRPVVGWCR